MSRRSPAAAQDDAVWVPLFVIWIVSLSATLGSLFFSEVMALPPCELCWYQRIAMYPIVVVSSVALWVRDRQAWRYLWPLVLPGLAVTAYHCLLYYGLIPAEITPCTTGVSCTERQLDWFGFVSIPLLSFVSFVAITGCLVRFHLCVRRGERTTKGSARDDQ